MAPGTVVITASMLYDHAGCPHRVHLDLRGDPALREPASAFVEMLWSEGAAHETEALAAVAADAVDLREVAATERRALTAAAIAARAPLILGGEVAHGRLLARPDVLRLEDCGHLPGDVKSGGARVSRGDGRVKPAYATQVALAADVLIRAGALTERRGFVWDRNGEEAVIDYDVAQGVRSPVTPWQTYAGALAAVGAIADGKIATRPAAGAACKLCRWRGHCKDELVSSDDVTLVPQLGPSLRGALAPAVATVADLADVDLGAVARRSGRTAFPGIGQGRLARFRDRARLIRDPSAGAYAREPLGLVRAGRELFLDIEVDPFGDRTYLHGVLERDAAGERFHAHLMEDGSAAGEEAAFASAWSQLVSDPGARIYVWSAYERTMYRALQARYPAVCSAADVEDLFATRVVDLLLDVASPGTDWPLHDMSLKTIAKHLGFAWRDPEPSGAASIEWYRRWIGTGDAGLRGRILEYNEDDCIASRVVFDGMIALPVRGEGERP